MARRVSKRKKGLKKRKKIKKIRKSQVQEKVFDFQPRKIKMKVVGIGGGGSSIVSGIAPKLKKIKFVVANTDLQALKKSAKGVTKFHFGKDFTRGLGTGMNPELAERAALAEIEKIKKIFRGQDLSILISCLGGGTGSGATPIFGQAAKDLKNYTLGIFTLPFLFEGEKRLAIALNALEKIRPNLNSIVIVPNERVFQLISQKTPIKEAFSAINKILAENLEGLIEMLYLAGLINIDFADVKTILSGKGRLSYLHTVLIQGGNKVEEEAKKILENPFYEYTMEGADRILFNISGGKDLKITEVEKISKRIADSNKKAKIIFGISENEKYKNKIKITLLAVGCREKPKISTPAKKKISKIKKITKITRLALASPRRSGSEAKRARLAEATAKRAKKSKKNKKKEIKSEESSTSKNLVFSPEIKEEKTEMKTRRNALELKQEAEQAEKEHLSREAAWDIPAFLRRRKK